MARHAIRAFTTMRALIAETVKVVWVKRKEKKELERLKAEQAANA